VGKRGFPKNIFPNALSLKKSAWLGSRLLTQPKVIGLAQLAYHPGLTLRGLNMGPPVFREKCALGKVRSVKFFLEKLVASFLNVCAKCCMNFPDPDPKNLNVKNCKI